VKKKRKNRKKKKIRLSKRRGGVPGKSTNEPEKTGRWNKTDQKQLIRTKRKKYRPGQFDFSRCQEISNPLKRREGQENQTKSSQKAGGAKKGWKTNPKNGRRTDWETPKRK